MSVLAQEIRAELARISDEKFQPVFLLCAAAMIGGIALTLSTQAILTVVGRESALAFVQRHGASIERVTLVLEGTTGFVLIWIGLRSFLR